MLNRDIKRISFEEIRKPTTAINDKLHNRRQDLTVLREEVQKATNWMPSSVHEQLSAIQAAATPDRAYIGFPEQTLKEILERSESLERFLMDSFNLLISSTSVLEAALSVEQGIRGQRLSQLAFLYVPLSFVTGIFGMNLKEINGSLLPAWVSVLALAVIVMLTSIILASHTWWERRRT